MNRTMLWLLIGWGMTARTTRHRKRLVGVETTATPSTQPWESSQTYGTQERPSTTSFQCQNRSYGGPGTPPPLGAHLGTCSSTESLALTPQTTYINME